MDDLTIHAEAIAAAIATGGYCFIGHGGTSIHWENETGGKNADQHLGRRC
jgi:hypothetical protein